MKDADARRFMEMAIFVMRQSIPEPRCDGKASPKVGAVLVTIRADGSPGIEDTHSTAYRGELRHGDHAEYTLLERKKRNQALDDCVLFATLEPCAPNARKHPKLGCAERIVLARIKEVWVGIADPDPTVDRKGIKHLQDNGIQVHMFDSDLQEIIRQENRDFMAQAQQRADEARAIPKDIVLSDLESAVANTQTDDLSIDALEAYRSSLGIGDPIDSVQFRNRLLRQGLLHRNGNRFVPSGFGLLLFGQEPRTAMPQAGLKATIHRLDGTEEIRDFDGPQVLVPGQVESWLDDKLPQIIDRSHAKHTDVNAPLRELTREGIVNALIHRDYDIAGAKCQLHVFPDRIEIQSPGQPVTPITLDQLQKFHAPSLSRNPVLHYVFAKMKLAEERGLGQKSMREKAVAAGLPLPKYSWNAPYLVLTLFRSVAASISTLPPEVLDRLSEAELMGWQWLTTKGRTSTQEYANAVNLTSRTAQRHLKRLVELGLVQVSGSGPKTQYEVI